VSGRGDGFEDRRLRAEVRARLFGAGREDGTADARRIGRWQILERLGQGAMGTVYRATDGSREAAVKIVLGKNPATATRLRREARALRELAHPNVVGIIEIGEFEHGDFVAMELVAGETLRRRFDPSISTLAWIERLAPIASALVAVGNAGLVHRDVKPDNILFGANDVPKLVDFGLAKPEPGSAAEEYSHLGDSLTHTGASVGTVGYAAPEQLLGKPVDHRADEFALAVTMCETLFGRLPFLGATADAIGLAAIAGRIDLPAATSRGPLGSDVAAVLRRALAPDPKARYADSGVFIEALHHAARRAHAHR
jgi:serine/threonine protein kinase